MNGDWAVPGYRHIRPLGEGASGTVMLAVQEATNAPVAIKYLSEQLRSDEGFLGRFRAEARLMAELDDPYVVRFYEYVETPHEAALVMELVDGVTLKDIVRSEGPTGPEAALLVLKGSLLGLSAAHALGVVHRDYKPGNVLVGDDGHSKLADFGIAVRVGEDTTASGTPAYMAPEQWAAGPVTASADVYAATAVFYECLTGERPYPVKGLWALATAHRTAPIPYRNVPEPLSGLVAHGLAKNPVDRPRSADAFLAELEQAALAGYGPGWEERGRVRLSALAALLATLFPIAAAGQGASTALALTRLGRRRLAMATGALVAAVFAGGGGAMVMAGVHRHIGTHSSATSSPAAAVEPSTSPPDSPSPSASPSPDPETTPPADPGGGPATEPATSPASSPPKTKKPSPVITEPKPTKVTGLTIDSFTIKGTVATAQVTVTVSGPGTVDVSATFGTEAPAVARVAAADSDVQQVTGDGPHSLTFDHDYGDRCVTATVTVTAGGLSKTMSATNCAG